MPFIEFILSHFDLSSTSIDEELFEKIVGNDPIAMQVAITCFNTWEYLTSTKLEKESVQLERGQLISLGCCAGDPKQPCEPHQVYLKLSPTSL